MPQELSLQDLRLAREVITRENWNDKAFSSGKAFVCSVFSECAYQHIPQAEVGDKSRVHIIPCEAYQRIALAQGSADVRRLLNEAGFGENVVDIYSTTYAVFVAITTPQVIFVAVRGTLPFYERGYDLFVDFNIWTTEHLLTSGFASFHTGFYHEAHQYFAPLHEKIAAKNYGKIPPIYVTGHSLGGAMAAVIHALWNYPAAGSISAMSTHSGYSFGMPRYGDRRAVSAFRSPYHTLRKGDPIPKVPLAPWYANSRFEFFPDGSPIPKRKFFQNWPLLHIITEPIWLFRDHSVERYRYDISRSI